MIGIFTLLISASLIFGELRSALNRIFEVRPIPPKREGFVWVLFHLVRDRVLHIGFALTFILALIVSLITTSLISATLDAEAKATAQAINIAISFVFYIGFFTLVFRYLPERHQGWLKSARGGALTAFLFVLGKEIIGLYLGSSALGSAYGAAGSIVLLLAWVYYSTLITFVGAQVSALIPKRRGQPRPEIT